MTPNAPPPRAGIPVLEYLQRQLDGTLAEGDVTHMRYPTAISRLLGFGVVKVPTIHN